MSGPFVKPFMKKVGRKALFKGSEYGETTDKSEFKIQNFEIEMSWIDGQDGIFYPLFTVGVDFISSQDHFYIRKTGAAFPPNNIAYRNNDEGESYSFGEANVLGRNNVCIRKYGTTLKSILNGGPEQTDTVQSLIVYYSGIAHVGTRSGSELGIFDLIKLKFYELNGSGDRISQLINFDVKTGDANTIPNIATSAPASSDMIWVPAGSGTYNY
jgi:hypothetical protein